VSQSFGTEKSLEVESRAISLLKHRKGNSVRKGNSATSNASMETEILADPDQDDEDSEPEPEFFEPEDLLALGKTVTGAISRLGSGISTLRRNVGTSGTALKTRVGGACAVGWNTIIEAGEFWMRDIAEEERRYYQEEQEAAAREEKKRELAKQAERAAAAQKPIIGAEEVVVGDGEEDAPDCGSARATNRDHGHQGGGEEKEKEESTEVQSPRGDVVAATALKVLPKAPSSVAAETKSPPIPSGKENVVFSRLSTSLPTHRQPQSPPPPPQQQYHLKGGDPQGAIAALRPPVPPSCDDGAGKASSKGPTSGSDAPSSCPSLSSSSSDPISKGDSWQDLNAAVSVIGDWELVE
jgi:hypothetical protein